ncbi:MAG: DUF4040 domain-containing protein, partial [Polyangiaceae bacterium]|nr:DUF4040 domain-containing protein [Polyangiaceae bacterium]
MLQTLAAIILVPLALAALALVLPPRWAGRAALAAPVVVLWLGASVWGEAPADGAPRIVPVSWFPSLGITADLRVDRLGAFFVLLIGAVGLGVFQYSRFYFQDQGRGTYWALLLAFMGSMLGIVLSDSLLLLVVFWELTTLFSGLLIGWKSEDEHARSGALRAFLITGAGGLAMLAGVVLMGQIAGTYTFSGLTARADTLVADPRHVAPLVLLLLGAFTKSAQFPFHTWLPSAMSAPAPVSAYLHSATMVKAGVLLAARLFPAFHASPVWLPLLVTVGLTTFVVAGWKAVRVWDVKQLLAYSTAAYLGLLFALYGLSARTGVRGELANIANHALYKSALFLLVGWIEKATGTRDLSLLRREHWFRHLPVGAALVGVGTFAMAGFPLSLGFVSKEILYEAALGLGGQGAVAAMVAVVGASALGVAYALKIFIGIFWGAEPRPKDRGHPPEHLSSWLLIIPGALLIPQVVGGLAPGWLMGSVLKSGDAWPRGPAVWHSADLVLVLGLATFGLGVVTFLMWRWFAEPATAAAPRVLGEVAAEKALIWAAHAGRAVQAGGHRRYIGVTVLFAVAALVAGLALGGALRGGARLTWGPHAGLAAVPAAMIMAGAVLTLLVRGRVTKLLMMALAGYGLAVYFVLFRAPDLALTQ